MVKHGLERVVQPNGDQTKCIYLCICTNIFLVNVTSACVSEILHFPMFCFLSFWLALASYSVFWEIMFYKYFVSCQFDFFISTCNFLMSLRSLSSRYYHTILDAVIWENICLFRSLIILCSSCLRNLRNSLNKLQNLN